MKTHQFLNLLFLFGFILIHRKEISYLPSPLSSINTIYQTNLSLLSFLLLLSFVFSVVPISFFLSISMWCIRYNVILPKDLPGLWNIFIKQYFGMLIDSTSTMLLVWIFYLPYEPDAYYFLRFSSVFPNTPISNIYTAEIFYCIFFNLWKFYFFIFILAFGSIHLKFPNLFRSLNFYLKNWTFLIVSFITIFYHGVMAFIIVENMNRLETQTTYDVSARLLFLMGCALSYKNDPFRYQ